MPAGQKKVLQASVELFALQGYSATSTAQIAEAAGVSQGTIFKYFKNKQALLNFILDSTIAQLIPSYSMEIMKRLKNEIHTARDFINFIIDDRYAFLSENRQLVLIVQDQFLTDDAFVKLTKEKLSDRFQFVCQTVDDLAGKDFTMPTVDLLQLIASQLLFLFLMEFRFKLPTKFDRKHELNQIKENVYQAALK
ncbi:AcrR family [Eupransor demetentiae]|uniref:AcrR family n=2 Tax=Eupransor demetentiae TaxID=3109584 RepID=A0ABP0EQD2_9LACO|nr:AcrR family [Lactobacillaceae bacterium LMG 33000]